MSSTPQTSGFQVNVAPGYQLANPSYFNPYQNLQQGLQSGVNMGAQLQDIVLKNKAEQDSAAIQPLRVQLMQAELARAQQQQRLTDINMPRQVALSSQPIETPIGTELGYTDYTDPENPKGDLVEYGHFKVVDPATQAETQVSRPIRTVKTAAQIEEERLNAGALRDYRGGLGAAAQQRAATAEQIAAWKQQNPTVKTKTVYDKDLNVFEQAINPDGSLGASVQVVLPNGQPAKRPASQMDGLAAALGALGGAQPTPTAPAGPVSGAAPSANLDALGNLANQFSAVPVTIQTKAQYDALPVGATYIDALTGTRHVKGR